METLKDLNKQSVFIQATEDQLRATNEPAWKVVQAKNEHIEELKKQNRILSTANRQWFDVWDKLKEEINNSIDTVNIARPINPQGEIKARLFCYNNLLKIMQELER